MAASPVGGACGGGDRDWSESGFPAPSDEGVECGCGEGSGEGSGEGTGRAPRSPLAPGAIRCTKRTRLQKRCRSSVATVAPSPSTCAPRRAARRWLKKAARLSSRAVCSAASVSSASRCRVKSKLLWRQG